MKIKIYRVEMSGGETLHHIVKYFWTEVNTGITDLLAALSGAQKLLKTGMFDRQQMVTFVRTSGNIAVVDGAGYEAVVEVVNPALTGLQQLLGANYQPAPYVKTRADSTRYDNLLYLPGGPYQGLSNIASLLFRR